MAKQKVSLAKVFRTIVLPRWKIVLLGIVLIMISRAATLVIPVSTKYLMDDVVAKGDLNMLKILLLAVIGSIIISAATSYWLTQLLSVEAQQLISQLRAQVQAHVLRLPVKFFDNTKSGALVSRIMADVEGVRNLVGTGLVQLFGGILTSVASLVMLLLVSPLMTLLAGAPVAILAVVAMRAFGALRPIFRERGKINAEVIGRLTETLNGVRVIKGFNAEKQETKIFELGVERLFLNVKKSLTTTSFVTSLGALLLGIASVSIMGVGAYKMIDHTLTTGEFTSFTVLLGFMIAPIVQMSNIGSQLTEAFAGLDRTEELMNTEMEDDGSVRTEAAGTIKGDIIFKDVSFAYEEGKDVLKNISFDSPAGSVTALVGRSEEHTS